jgi:hypothetical protein
MICALLVAPRPADAVGTWVQPGFIIGAFSGPCLDFRSPAGSHASENYARVKAMRDAHFNYVLGGLVPAPGATGLTGPTAIDSALAYAGALGMRVVVNDERLFCSGGCFASSCSGGNGVLQCLTTCGGSPCIDCAVAHYATGLVAAGRPELRAAQDGYYLKDEPCEAEAPGLRSELEQIRNGDLTRFGYFNLYPVHVYAPGPNQHAQYEAYLDAFLSGGSSYSQPQAVSYDFYPFTSAGGFLPDYFYNIRIVHKKAGTRPFWAYVISTNWINHTADPDSTQLRFMAFCPVAYGAKGVGYYPYIGSSTGPEQVGGVVNDCSTLTPRYYEVQKLNNYLEQIVGPMTMASNWVGTYHKSTVPTGEALGSDDNLATSRRAIVTDLYDAGSMVGIFRHKTSPSVYHLIVVNKRTGPNLATTASVVLKGNYTGRVLLAPRMTGFVSDTTFQAATVTWSSYSNTSTVALTLSGGEARVLRLTGVNILAPNTDYDGDGIADISVKTDSGSWKIDYSQNGFGNGNSWDFQWDVSYGLTDSHPVPADYDGDGRADISVKSDAGAGQWKIDWAYPDFGFPWDNVYDAYGGVGANPVPADYNGDGIADLSIKTDWGTGGWLIDYSGSPFGGWDLSKTGQGGYGVKGVPADYDGDGRADIAVFEPTQLKWRIDYASDGFGNPDWDVSISTPMTVEYSPYVADYDGDGRADLAVVTEAGAWFIRYSMGGSWAGPIVPTPGLGPEDYFEPVPADYDGDGKADIALKTYEGEWRIDYAMGGFGTWDVTYTGKGNNTVHGLHKGPGDVATADALPNLAEFSVGPNPSPGPVNVRFTLRRDASVQVSMYDVAGRKTANLYSGEAAAGLHEIPSAVAAGTQPPGVYFVRVTVDGETTRRRFVLLNR